MWMDWLPPWELGEDSEASGSTIATEDKQPPIAPKGFEVFIDPGSATKEEVADLLNALSKVNRAFGGNGLSFSPDKQYAYRTKGELAP